MAMIMLLPSLCLLTGLSAAVSFSPVGTRSTRVPQRPLAAGSVTPCTPLCVNPPPPRAQTRCQPVPAGAKSGHGCFSSWTILNPQP